MDALAGGPGAVASARSMKPLKSAWVVRCEGTTPNIPSGLVAVLNYRRTKQQVAMVIEHLYAAATATDEEKVLYARHGRNNPYPVTSTAFPAVVCGANP